MKKLRFVTSRVSHDIDLRNGFFQFAADTFPTSEEFSRMRPEIIIGIRQFKIDHVAVCVKDLEAWQTRMAEMVALGAELVEGPGLFPSDFCDVDVPLEMNLRFASLVMPVTGITVVLSTFVTVSDQISEFLRQHGEAIHHVAIASKDFAETRDYLKRYDFLALSDIINDGDLKQMFLRNSQGQVVELIARRTSESGTFSCGNIAQLRLSEMKKAA